MQSRLKQFKQRLPRFHALRRVGVNTAVIVRTGGGAALMHGYQTIGVAPSVLLHQRWAVNRAAAPANGLGGQELEFAMMFADGTKKGKADPAFEAHTGVVSHWAQAIWNKWLPLHDLQASLDDAKARTAGAAQPWRVVYGPAAALVCTLQRLNWTITSATKLVTDKGRILDLTVDPPVVVARQTDHSVRRWRWRNVAAAHPSLPEAGANFDPILKLVNSKSNSEEWNPILGGALRSVVAGRQYPQLRCFNAGWVEHPCCIFCLHSAVTNRRFEATMPTTATSRSPHVD